MTDVLEYVKDKEAQLAAVSTIRVNDSIKANITSYRSNADVDYARVIYSSAYRRLQGKMQLFIPKSEVFYRNRLTHSHEVAQIAKTLAKKFEVRDILTVQTCSLAHDIGNPPFGHAGEAVLNNLFNELPYEGNAQTYRILNWLEERHYGHNGLNLTIRTMLGVVKYLNKPDKGVTKFLYSKDFEQVSKWLTDYSINHKTIDCEIMDIADEIAYSAHDLEDALKLKYFTIDELLHEFKVSIDYKDVYDELNDIVQNARDFANKAVTYKTSEEYAMLFRKQLTSIIVDKLLDDIGLTASGVIGYTKLEKLSKGLKKLTFEAIKRQPDIIEYEQLGKQILQSLFELYTDMEFNKGMVLMPANYRHKDTSNPRAVASRVQDYIGGMTDAYAIYQYEKYFGKLEGKGLYLKR